MEQLIKDPGLVVMQTEFSVYVLLRLWLFLIFHPNWEGSPTEAVVSSHRFFQVYYNFCKNFVKLKIHKIILKIETLFREIEILIYTGTSGKR